MVKIPESIQDRDHQQAKIADKRLNQKGTKASDTDCCSVHAVCTPSVKQIVSSAGNSCLSLRYSSIHCACLSFFVRNSEQGRPMLVQMGDWPQQLGVVVNQHDKDRKR